MYCHSNPMRPLTSIVSYPERGDGGDSRYRGNCSPKLIEDLIGFFKPKEICDYMCGSGTTKAAADKAGIRSHLYDLHSGFDIMNCDIPERPEFVFWHPPYWDIIQYSDVMYKASDVMQKYGYDPKRLDLSRIERWDDFVSAMNYAMMKQFSALENGGRMAVLMGDIKKKGRLYSMLAEIVKMTADTDFISRCFGCAASAHIIADLFGLKEADKVFDQLWRAVSAVPVVTAFAAFRIGNDARKRFTITGFFFHNEPSRYQHLT